MNRLNATAVLNAQMQFIERQIIVKNNMAVNLLNMLFFVKAHGVCCLITVKLNIILVTFKVIIIVYSFINETVFSININFIGC